MNAIITHECSGMIRNEMRALGINAWSCDLKQCADDSPHHIQGDALIAIDRGCPNGVGDFRWHIIIMHPECTYLNGAGIHWNNRGRGWVHTHLALAHVMKCMSVATRAATIGWALENPVGIIGTKVRPADQWIQPYEFGDDASKKTGLWLHGLPCLKKGKMVRPRWICPQCGLVATHPEALQWMDGQDNPRCTRCPWVAPKLRPRWSNQTDSGQNRLGPSEHRASDRARTYPGIARAMAEQWGTLKTDHSFRLS